MSERCKISKQNKVLKYRHLFLDDLNLFLIFFVYVWRYRVGLLGNIEIMYQFRISIQILLLIKRNFGFFFEQKIVTV